MELQNSEALGHLIIENALDGIIIVDENLIIKSINPSAEKMFDYKAIELVGQNIKMLIPQAYHDKHDDYVNKCPGVGSGNPFNRVLEVVAKHKSGVIFPIEISLSQFRTGQEVFFVVIVRDITERKWAEELLKESEERYRSLFENNHVVVLLIDPDTGDIVDANPSACAYYGYKKEEFITKKIMDINTLTREQIFEQMERARLVKQQLFYSTHHLKDGKIRDVEVYSGSIIIKGKNLLYLLIHDVTERKIMEEKLKLRKKFFRGIVEDQTELICRSLPDATVTFVNQAYCRYFGKKRKELIGMDFMPRILVEDREKVKNSLDAISKENPVTSFEQRVELDNGEVRCQQWTERGIFDDNGELIEYQAVGHDITELKRAEQELVDAQKKAVQSEKLASLGVMAAGIAHEINQPLNALKITVDSMLYWQEKGKNIDIEKLTKNLRKVSAQASRINEIIKHMRSFVRNNTLELFPCDINCSINGALNLLTNEFFLRGIQVRKKFKKVPLIKGNAAQLEEVVVNLLVNAMQVLDDIDKEEKEVVCVTRLEENHVVLEVCDNATGIREEIKEKIFDPFYTTKEVGEGMGIGLSIVHAIVTSYGGQIKIYNNKKGGATLRVEFPAWEQGD